MPVTDKATYKAFAPKFDRLIELLEDRSVDASVRPTQGLADALIDLLRKMRSACEGGKPDKAAQDSLIFGVFRISTDDCAFDDGPTGRAISPVTYQYGRLLRGDPISDADSKLLSRLWAARQPIVRIFGTSPHNKDARTVVDNLGEMSRTVAADAVNLALETTLDSERAETMAAFIQIGPPDTDAERLKVARTRLALAALQLPDAKTAAIHGALDDFEGYLDSFRLN